mgnify:CR=1 FL=1
MKFNDAREKFLRAVGAVEAFGLDVDSKDVEELGAIIDELIAWFDRRYPHVEREERNR